MYSKSNLSVFSILLPQLSQMYPSVNAAAAAFGAAYDSTLIRDGNSFAYDNSTKQTGLALQMLQLELNRPDPQYAPVLMASILLAAAESIQARQKGALAHVHGTFGLFMSNQAENRLLQSPENSSVTSSPQRARGGLSNDLANMLEHMCLSLDVLVATFTWGHEPHLPPQPFSETTFNPTNIDELCQELPKLIHNSMHVISQASKKLFNEPTVSTVELRVKQSQMISWLRKWLSSFSDLVESQSARSQPIPQARNRHLHSLKAQCLSTILAVSNLLAPSQASWDKYALEFSEIVKCADIVLNSGGQQPYHKPALRPFSPSPGIIQPLFFTARKYRHSHVRRRAISLLRLTGFEGPFSGDFEADVATRFVEIEEGRPYSEYLGVSQVMTPADIPDNRRIYSCWRLSERYDFDERVIKLCRRRQSQSSPTTNTLDDDENPFPSVAEDWEVWEEVILSYKRRSEIAAKGAVGATQHDNRAWVPLEGDADYTVTHHSLRSDRLSRDPDWVKSAVGSGQYWNFWDHPDDAPSTDPGRRRRGRVEVVDE